MVDDVVVCEHLANSDHNTLFFTFNISTIVKESCHTRYNFHKGNYGAMRQHLAMIDWDKEMSSNNASEMWRNFCYGWIKG